ncbi:MAG: hypothetical protein HY902_19435 [Deltaproteobacteria bacterium]|nr:hypothetical protein [Deltaproteobacteria bacterium]
MPDRATVIADLEHRFRQLSELLYDTSVDPKLADAAIAPLLADDVTFTDPWQQASGRDKYRLGIAGFHAMLRFKLDIWQLSVQLSEDARRCRVLVDGVMQLQPLGAWYTFPLRTQLVYDCSVAADGTPTVHAHEEMWSFGDLLAAVPLGGALYRRLFRPAFARGFLLASRLTARARGMLPPGV